MALGVVEKTSNDDLKVEKVTTYASLALNYQGKLDDEEEVCNLLKIQRKRIARKENQEGIQEASTAQTTKEKELRTRIQNRT